MLKIKSLQKFNEINYDDLISYAENLDQVYIVFNEITSLQTLKQAIDDIRKHGKISGKSTVSATIIAENNATNTETRFRFIVSNEKVKDKIISAEISMSQLSLMPNEKVMSGTVGRILFKDTQKINDIQLSDLMSKVYISIMKLYENEQ